MSSHLFTAALAATLAAFVTVATILRRWRGPLSHLPGPFLTKFTDFRVRRELFKGTRLEYLQKLHDEYGPVVRTGPSDVSVAGLEATRDIHKIAGGYLKTDFYTKLLSEDHPTLFTARDPATHQTFRRLLAPTMSESAVRNILPVVQEKVDLFMSQISKERKEKGRIDIGKWAYYYTTDVIGELAFGDSFKMLETGKESQYITDVKNFGSLNIKRQAVLSYPLYALPRVPFFNIEKLMQMRDRLNSYALQCVNAYKEKLAADPDSCRPMFFTNMVGERGASAGMSDVDTYLQARGLIVAGTDTTATTLTFTLYNVARRPEVRSKLVAAISRLPERPTNEQLKEVAYLEHVIEESLRLFGAAPGPLPRAVPQGGRTLQGHFVPGGQTVSPVAWVLHRDPAIFPDPEKWQPERWERATDDMRHAFHAFGGGSRVCIGLNVARAELRMAVFAFFRAFPDAAPAYGVDGFANSDMDVRESFIIRPKGGRCLIK